MKSVDEGLFYKSHSSTALPIGRSAQRLDTLNYFAQCTKHTHQSKCTFHYSSPLNLEFRDNIRQVYFMSVKNASKDCEKMCFLYKSTKILYVFILFLYASKLLMLRCISCCSPTFSNKKMLCLKYCSGDPKLLSSQAAAISPKRR